MPVSFGFASGEAQEEIDRSWEKLSEGGEKMECGWLKDKYGVRKREVGNKSALCYFKH